jgi:myo-inositol-1(or 4)-monophosphatase
MGSAALDYAYVSAGRLDAFMEGGNNLWDLAAGKLLVEEAGGLVSLTPLEEKYRYSVCATNGKIKLDYGA